MELIALRDQYVVYKTDSGNIIAEPITQSAQEVLKWYAKNIPANN